MKISVEILGLKDAGVLENATVEINVDEEDISYLVEQLNSLRKLAIMFI